MSEFVELYRKMTRLACFVADEHTEVTDYERDDIQMLVGEVGHQAVDDFYEMVGQIYGVDVSKIRGWIDEIDVEDE
jgi:cephalosporin hydroxylase